MSSLRHALLFLRTLPTLRWEQWCYRPVRRLQARLGVPAPAVGLDRRSVAAMAQEIEAWGAADPSYLERADRVLEGTFRFLNRAVTLPEIDWSGRPVSPLWSYNLHYFEYGTDLAWACRATGDERYLRRFTDLALGWIRDTRPGRGDGWQPYPLSIRVVQWIQALLVLGDRLEAGDRDRVESSLATQVAYLERRLEWHILGNHLAKNLTALVTAGLYFEGRAATRWSRRGRRLLWREVFEQVLPDGVHYERSPMYHAIVLGDLLEVAALMGSVGEKPPDGVMERISGMVTALATLSRPDGALHLFNDTAEGIAPARERIDTLARRVLGRGVPVVEGPTRLTSSGYYGFVGGAAGVRILVDCGDPGPSYQPGHAHCDLLSFELDIWGLPLVVDSGVRGYGGDPFREYVRSTRAHNTVSVGRREQSEVWSTFRMARRAEVLGASTSTVDGRFTFTGSYRPYHDHDCVHERRIEGERNRWHVVDRVRGAMGSRIDGFLHLHPRWRVGREGGGFVARSGEAAVLIEPFAVDDVRVRVGEGDPPQGWFCPEFGKAMPAPALEMTLNRNDEREFGYTLCAVTG